jgi:hypothetical protein
MEKQTIIFTALPNGREADGSLLLSVFISPRLWDTDPSITKMKLSQFDDFKDWPNRVNAATWQVVFEGGPTLNATVAGGPVATKEFWTALFKDNTDVLPYRFDDYRGAVIESFPSDVIHDFLVGVYTRAASSPGLGAGKDLPSLGALAADPGIRDIADDVKPQDIPQPGPPPPPRDEGGSVPAPEPEPPTTEPSTGCCLCGCLIGFLLLLAKPFPGLRSRLKKFCAQGQPPPEKPALATEPKPVPEPPAPPLPVVPPLGPPPKPPKPPSVNRTAFADLQTFLTPATEVAQALPTIAELQQKYDFHQMVAALADYPTLLRRFGLVVDLRVELNGAAVPGQSRVSVVPTLTLTDAADTTPVSPRTNYDLGADTFAALPRPVDPEISNGMLRFNTSMFQVVQVDLVGGGAKAQGAANNIVAAANDPNPSPNTPDNSGLPALRSGGISVIRPNMVPDLIGRFQRSHALQQFVFAQDAAPQRLDPPGAPPALPATDELFAEDLVHGYRIDVFDTKSNRWHSLCQRVGTYTFLDAPDAPGGSIVLNGIEDEGFVQFAVTEPLGPQAQRKLRTRDSLFVWEGWSLVAPRIGKSIMPNKLPDPIDKVTLDKPKNEAITNFKLQTSFTAKPGSLPRLRFDHTYRLRARVCDLAGNSVFDPDDAAFANDVTEQTPDFQCARFEPVGPPAMMLREEPVEGESLEHLVVRSPAVGGESQITERHIVPPKVSQLMAEQHGKFDLATQKMDSSTTTGYNTAAREAGALNDPPAVEVKKDVWVNAGNQFTVSYLPDPASRGTLLMGLPGLANDDEIVEPTAVKRVNKIPFDGTWPNPLPFRLRLVAIGKDAPSAEPRWEDTPGDPRVLVVELAESEKKVVRISSYLAAEDMDRQGVLQWTREQAPLNLATIESDTESGRSWLHLPWRDITLVHAVQQPLEQPTAAVVTPAGKNLGETFATISGTLTTHVASTGKVDLIGNWKDPIDDPAEPKPGEQTGQTYLCEVLIDEKDVTTPIKSSANKKNPIHNFGDTKFHKVRYTPTATTRFREYFPPSITGTPANITLAGPPSNEVTILNSARPAAPKVLYVIPTYEWEDEPPAGGKVTRKRKGGLRVYLDRPWYSSGDGELLGVVYVDNVNFTELDEKVKKLVTVWGADPIWLTGPTEANATAARFTGTKKDLGGLTIAENPQTVSVAGYEPHFDETRQLWFADIQLDVGDSYAPFVRLGLARFQPESVPNAHLSNVVRAQFAQLAPDRTASITTTTTPSSAKFEIFVSGLTYVASSATTSIGFAALRNTGQAEFEALLQKRSATMGNDPDIGWDTLASTLLTPESTFGEWKGELNILEALAPNTWRVLIKEYEWYRADFQPEEQLENLAFDRRIVYAVAIPLG